MVGNLAVRLLSIIIKQAFMHSSLGLTSKTIMNKQQARKCRTILNALLEHNQSSDFKQPVDWKGMQLTDYPTIVKHPMDLNTIDTKLRNEKYDSVENFLDHVQLVWDNCKLYNRSDSMFYDIAEKLERSYKKLVKNYFPDIPIVVPIKAPVPAKNNKRHVDFLDPEEGITYYDKLDFSYKIEALGEKELQKFMEWLADNYPEVVKNLNEERMQILVDNFTPVSFLEALQAMRNISDGQFDLVVKKVKPN